MGSGPAGLGLTSMRQRAAEIGAILSVASAPGKGTKVSLELPISRSGT